MESKDLKIDGKNGVAIWIDEMASSAGMVMQHPSMNTLIKPSWNRAGSQIMVSTPPGVYAKPFGDHMKEFSDWYWFEHQCKATLVGKLLYA